MVSDGHRKVFKGHRNLHHPLNQAEHEQEFLAAMRQSGIKCFAYIIADGTFHRFAHDGKGDKDGWYIFHGTYGAFGDWKRDIKGSWSIKYDHLPFEARKVIQKQIAEVQKACYKEIARLHEEAAQDASTKWQSYADTGQSDYLTQKKISAIGIRFDRNTIVVPVNDIDGKLWTLQFIDKTGKKRFLKDGRKKGGFHTLGYLNDTTPVLFVVEGYATGVTVFMAMNVPVVIAFDAGSLDPVTASLRHRYPNIRIVIVADNDLWKEENIGLTAAQNAAKKYGCTVVYPTFKPEHHSRKPTDFNDLMILEGEQAVIYQIGNVFHQKKLKALNVQEFLDLDIPPRGMILRPIIPEKGLTMLYAPRGLGKTYVALTIANAVANGSEMFDGRWKTGNPRKVLFVDGEMPAESLKERLKAIVKKNNQEFNPRNLVIISQDFQEEGIPDLFSVEGQKVIEEHLEGVKLVILDNLSSLCRSGKENEGDSWLFIQGWLLSLRRRNISVLIVHHANKQGQQRGTSRREDLLDTVIALRQIEQRDAEVGAQFEVHYEKARGFYGEDAKPFEVRLVTDQSGVLVWYAKDLESDTQIHELLQQGFTQRGMAKEMNTSVSTINRRVNKLKGTGQYDA